MQPCLGAGAVVDEVKVGDVAEGHEGPDSAGLLSNPHGHLHMSQQEEPIPHCGVGWNHDHLASQPSERLSQACGCEGSRTVMVSLRPPLLCIYASSAGSGPGLPIKGYKKICTRHTSIVAVSAVLADHGSEVGAQRPGSLTVCKRVHLKRQLTFFPLAGSRRKLRCPI